MCLTQEAPRPVTAERLEDRVFLSLAGNQLFPADNPWNHPIIDAPVAANSQTLVNSIGADSPLHPDFGTTWQGAINGIPYSVVDGSQPLIPVVIDDYLDESDIVPVPMPANPVIEGEAPGGSADFISLPSFAQVTMPVDHDFTWDYQTTDPRALDDPLTQVPQAASTWYSSTSFTINLNITDGLAHRIALYMVDYDQAGRSQRVDVINPANNQVLASQSVSDFEQGEYLVFDVTGNVLLTFTNTAADNINYNAVLSGLFFGAPGSSSIPASSSPTAAFVRADTTTSGNWIGTYGADGYSLAPLEDDSDRHLIIYDTANQTDYEFWEAFPPSEEPDGKWHAANEAVWNMATDTFRPPGWTSADAAGLPILPGLVRTDEVLSQGAITHALRFTVPDTYGNYIFPASHQTHGDNPDEPAMGQRFRLNPDFDISSFSPADQVILQALKTYGMIVADNGSPWFLSGAPSSQWSDDDLHNLTQVIGSDFQAVDLTPVITSVSQTSGSGGTVVIVHGINFTGVAGQIEVEFGSVAGTNLSVINDNELTVTEPAGTPAGADITVVTPYGSSASTWKTTLSGDWNTAANWYSGVPNSIDARAEFLNTSTIPQTVSSAVGVTAALLELDNSGVLTLTGSGSLTLSSNIASAVLDVQAGTASINLPVTLSSAADVNVDSNASLAINAPITDATGSTLAVSIAAGARFTLADPGASIPQVVQITSLAVSPGGTLNLVNSDLDIQQGDLAGTTALVDQGFNGGGSQNWTGTGITSTTAAGDGTHLTALGVILNTTDGTTPLYGEGTPLGAFDGTSPAPSDILVKYTYFGDANLDGKVDGSDYARIDNGYLNQLTGWYNGDFNFDGVVNGSDYTLIDNSYNRQGTRFADQVTTSVRASVTPPPAAEPLVTGASPDPWSNDAPDKLKKHRGNAIFAG